MTARTILDDFQVLKHCVLAHPDLSEPSQVEKADPAGGPRDGSGDIAEVEAVIAILLAQISFDWSQRIQAAVAAVLALQDDVPVLEPSDNARRDAQDQGVLEDALWTVLFEEMNRPFGDLGRAMRLGTRSLLEDGATVSGHTLSFDGRLQSIPGTPALLLLRRGEQDLSNLLVGHVTEHESEIRTLLRRWLLEPELRTRLRGAWQQMLSDQLAWRGQWLPAVVDVWAYRWYSIGAFLAGHEAGVQLYVFNNPPDGPDDRTTSFCRWAHGRPIDMAYTADRIRTFLDAADQGNVPAMKSVWPLKRWKKDDGPAEFQSDFMHLGAPPYHWRCRSVPLPKAG